MSLTAAAIRLMAEKGLSALDIAEIAESMGVANARSPNAERQARYRARQKGEVEQDNATSDVTNNVTRDVTDVTEAPLSLPPNDIYSNPPTHTPGNTPRPRRADDFPMPDFCADPQTWRDFKTNRKAKSLPCTPSAHAKLIRDIHRLADEEWPPGRLFDEIVARGWAAAHDPRENRTPRNDNRRQGTSGTATAAQRAIALIENRSG